MNALKIAVKSIFAGCSIIALSAAAGYASSPWDSQTGGGHGAAQLDLSRPEALRQYWQGPASPEASEIKPRNYSDVQIQAPSDGSIQTPSGSMQTPSDGVMQSPSDVPTRSPRNRPVLPPQ